MCLFSVLLPRLIYVNTHTCMCICSVYYICIYIYCSQIYLLYSKVFRGYHSYYLWSFRDTIKLRNVFKALRIEHLHTNLDVVKLLYRFATAQMNTKSYITLGYVPWSTVRAMCGRCAGVRAMCGCAYVSLRVRKCWLVLVCVSRRTFHLQCL